MNIVGNLRRISRVFTTAGLLSIGYCSPGMAQGQSNPEIRNPATLFENVRVFDGRTPAARVYRGHD